MLLTWVRFRCKFVGKVGQFSVQLNNHSPVVAKEAFSTMESLLYWRLRRWAMRRHPKKTD
ncbi:group II intron maturase-specific domain-containing protein, partial [Vibrio parahaemolyticus]|uniref:group II intron maturase-specific domain-containing protein n=1 Tax=Vibrio parahaemolyticus TaxID=670 RepID=UPI003526EB63